MRQVRAQLARFTVLLGVFAWVTGWGASLVHQSVTLHATCEVHGDVVDVGHSASADRVAVKALDVAADHDHDCAFHALGVARAPSLHTPVAHVEREVRADAPWPDLDAPRGPPLRYAPKTSPPLNG
jgi:hypothetical protein